MNEDKPSSDSQQASFRAHNATSNITVAATVAFTMTILCSSARNQGRASESTTRCNSNLCNCSGDIHTMEMPRPLASVAIDVCLQMRVNVIDDSTIVSSLTHNIVVFFVWHVKFLDSHCFYRETKMLLFNLFRTVDQKQLSNMYSPHDHRRNEVTISVACLLINEKVHQIRVNQRRECLSAITRNNVRVKLN